MNEPAAKAVFLSYASQDAAAAQRVCEALRTAGIEVWFDQNELVGGDAWDQKIRKQIRECALLIPVISQTTQGRREAYFRLEWKLADERTHLMAKGTPFLLPVTIDGTGDRGALVPDSFLAVQWTKAPAGELPPAFVARVQRLLAQAGEPGVRESGSRSPVPSPSAPGAAGPKWLKPILASAAIVIAVLAFTLVRNARAPGPVAPTPAAPTPAPATATDAPRDWPKDPELKRAMGLLDRLDAIPEDFRLAEEIAQRAVDRMPADAEAVTALSRVQAMWIMRGWDRSTARYQKAKSTAERALQLAPDEPEALSSLAVCLFNRGGENARALQLAQRAVDLAPQVARFHRWRDNILFFVEFGAQDTITDQSAALHAASLERGLESARRTIERFPQDPLARYELARHYRDLGRWADFERLTDETLALAPVANALVWKARARFALHGDLPGMKALLDQVPARVRGIERTVFSYFLYAAFTGDTRDAFEVINGMTESWLIDFNFRGPRALLLAELYAQSGKKELARLNYENALAELQRARAANPDDLETYLMEAWIKHGLGRDEEARAALRTYNESVPRPYFIGPMGLWWLQTIAANLLLGERETALALMREASATNAAGRATLRSRLQLDPRFVALRQDPEIQALLADPVPAATAPARVDEKSIAVLAFANLSDDKANEYFSDGISEELLNVLAKIPNLKVSARTSAFSFKGREVSVPEIARQLGVAYVVEGSVRKQGEKVRITAQLIKAADGFHVWSDTFTRDLKDVFAVQDEIAGLIARNLELKLGTNPAAARPVNPEAYNLLVRGRAQLYRGAPEDGKRAREYFQQAVKLDPQFALAWAWLSVTNWTGAASGWLPIASGFEEARTAAEQALALDPDSPAALAARGMVYYGYNWDWERARRDFDRALELAPSDASALSHLSRLATTLGHGDEAVRLGRRAIELDPLNTFAHYGLSMALFQAGRFDEMAEHVKPFAELSAAAGKQQVFALLMLHRGPDALAAANRLPSDWFMRPFLLALVHWDNGDRAASTAALQELTEKAAANGAYQIAEAHAFRGEKEPAFQWLETSFRQRDTGMIWLKNDPFFRPLHDDPRWADLLRRMNLSDQPAASAPSL